MSAITQSQIDSLFRSLPNILKWTGHEPGLECANKQFFRYIRNHFLLENPKIYLTHRSDNGFQTTSKTSLLEECHCNPQLSRIENKTTADYRKFYTEKLINHLNIFTDKQVEIISLFTGGLFEQFYFLAKLNTHHFQVTQMTHIDLEYESSGREQLIRQTYNGIFTVQELETEAINRIRRFKILGNILYPGVDFHFYSSLENVPHSIRKNVSIITSTDSGDPDHERYYLNIERLALDLLKANYHIPHRIFFGADKTRVVQKNSEMSSESKQSFHCSTPITNRKLETGLNLRVAQFEGNTSTNLYSTVYAFSQQSQTINILNSTPLSFSSPNPQTHPLDG